LAQGLQACKAIRSAAQRCGMPRPCLAAISDHYVIVDPIYLDMEQPQGGRLHLFQQDVLVQILLLF
jgi:hypothetical protein